MSYYRDQLELWLKTIDVNAGRVLDIGGGANPVKDRVKFWNVRDYRILDNRLEVMKQEPDFNMDINETVNPFLDDEYFEFDVVFCLEVFEYIWNPVKAMENIAVFLKKDGIAYISFPFIYPQHNPERKDYLRYTRYGVEKLLENAGFEIIGLFPRKEMIANSELMLPSWFMKEGMHPDNVSNHNEIGYLIMARKK